MAIKAVADRGLPIRVACQAFRISESCYRYERKLDADPDGQCKFPRLWPPQTPPGKDGGIMTGRC